MDGTIYSRRVTILQEFMARAKCAIIKRDSINNKLIDGLKLMQEIQQTDSKDTETITKLLSRLSELTFLD